MGKGTVLVLLILLSTGTVIGLVWYDSSQKTAQKKNMGVLLFIFGSTPPSFEIRGYWSGGGYISYAVDNGPQYIPSFPAGQHSLFLRGYKVQCCVWAYSGSIQGYLYLNGVLVGSGSDSGSNPSVVMSGEYTNRGLMQTISLMGLLLLL